jgi:hypothetical protein
MSAARETDAYRRLKVDPLRSWLESSWEEARVLSVEDWAEIRRLYRAEGMPIKQVARVMGVSKNTVKRALAADGPPRYVRAPRGSIVDPVEPRIRELLAAWPTMPATVIAERIGWTRGLTVLKDRIRERRPAYLSLPGRPRGGLLHRRRVGGPSGRRPCPGVVQPELTRLGRYQLLVVNEVGYIPFEAEAANLFFHLVSARYGRASLIVTRNKPIGRWGEVVGDDVVAAAMIDRLVHHAEVISSRVTATGSRTATLAASRRPPPTSDDSKRGRFTAVVDETKSHLCPSWVGEPHLSDLQRP